jgi:PGF-CTERM protein
VTVRETTVRSLGPTGIYVSETTNVTLADNLVEGISAGSGAPLSVGNGIEILAGADGALLDGNVVDDVGGDGIVVVANDTEVSGGIVSDTRASGIALREERYPDARRNVTVRDTTLDDVNETGILVERADGVTLRNLSISDTNETAISLESSGNVTVENSSVSWSAALSGDGETSDDWPDGFVYVDDDDGNLKSLAADGTKTDYRVSDAVVIGPRAFLDRDALREVPYVDDRGNLKIVDATGTVETLVSSGTLGTDPRTGTSKLAVGNWDHDQATDVFFANGNGDLYRVDWNERGDPERITTTAQVQYVVASVDVTGDGLRDLLYVSTDSTLRYVNSTGADTKITVDSTWGANNQIGFGEPARRNGTYVSPRVSGSETAEIQYFNGTVSPLPAGLSVAKTAPTAVDWAGGPAPEYLFIGNGGREVFYLTETGASVEVADPQKNAVNPDESIGLASRVETLAKSERVTGTDVDAFASRNDTTAQTVTNLTVDGVGTVSFVVGNISVDAEPSLPPDPAGARNLTGTGLRLLPTAGNGHLFHLTVAYTDADLDGADETTARLARFEQTTGEWVFDSSTVDTGSNTVTATVGPPDGVVAAFVNESDGGGGADTTPPTISSYTVTNPTGSTVRVSFTSNEQLDTISLAFGLESVTDPETVPRGGFTETTTQSGEYQYTFTANVSEGTYTGTLLTAEDADGNDGAASETGTAIVDTTPPTISNYTVTTISEATAAVAFTSDEQLDAITLEFGTDSAVEPSYFYRNDFTEQLNENGGYTYTFTVNVSSGTYTGTLLTAEDADGNDGAASETASVTVGTTAAETFTVDADGEAAFTTIQEALDTASDGDTVEVRAGTYAEQLTLRDNVTLVFADGAVLNGSSLSGETTGIRITDDAAPTIDGLTLRNFAVGIDAAETSGAWHVENASLSRTADDSLFAEGSTGAWSLSNSTVSMAEDEGIDADLSRGAWTLRNVTVSKSERGVSAAESSGSWRISDTRIENTTEEAILAVVASGNWTVDGTTITGTGEAGLVAWATTGDWTVNGSTLRTTSESGIAASQSRGNWVVANTTVDGVGAMGIVTRAATGDWAVRESTITNTTLDGIFAYGATGEWTVTESTIAAIGRTGLVARGTDTGSARRNYWGASDGPGGSYRGSGARVAGTVPLGPIYTDAARTATATAPPEQPTEGSISVIPGGLGPDTIQEAVDRADPGDTISVFSGTYREQVRVGLDVTVEASGVTLNGSQFTGVTAGLYVLDGEGVTPTFESLTITGYDYGVYAAGTAGDWTLENATLDRTRYGVVASGSSGNWTISDTEIRNVTEYGVYARNASGDWEITHSLFAVGGPSVPDGIGGIGTPDTTTDATLDDSDVSVTAIYAVDTSGTWRVSNTSLAAIPRGINATGANPAGDATGNWWGSRDGASGTDCVGNVSCGEPMDDQPGLLAVDSVSVDKEIVVGGDADVTVVVENTDEKSRSGTVTVSFGGTVIETLTVSLAPGETRTVTTSISTAELTAGAVSVTAQTVVDNEVESSETAATVVNRPASLDVSRMTVPPVATPNQRVAVPVTLTNTGDITANQTVHLRVDTNGDNEFDPSETVDSVRVTVSAGETVNRTLVFDTGTVEGGTYTVGVATANDSATGTLSVQSTAPDLSVSTSNLSVGAVDLGESASGTVTLTNTGGTPLNVTSVTVRGGDEAAFTVTNPGRVTLQSNESRTVTVSVTAPQNSAGMLSTTVRVQSTDPESPLVDVGVTANATGPVAGTNTEHQRFYSQSVGSTTNMTVLLDNLGNEELTVSDVSITGADASAFTVISDPATVGADGTQGITLSFTPQSGGDKRATLVIETNDPNDGTIRVKLTGAGSQPDVSVTPATVAFGEVGTETTLTRNVTVRNVGGAPLAVENVTLAGADAFTIVAGNGSGTLVPGETRTVTIRLAPDAAGGLSGTLTVNSDDPDEPSVAVSLSGVGQAADVSLTTATKQFGTVRVGSSSLTSVTLTNTGNETLVLRNATVTGADGSAFAVVTADGIRVPAGETRSVSVALAPETTGSLSGTLELTTNDPDEETVTVALSGTGAEADVTANPASVAFGPTQTGTTETRTVTITNEGRASTTISSVSFAGSPSAFSVSGGTTTLAPGERTQVTITFAPTSQGERAAVLQAINGTGAVVTNVSVGGVGAVPDVKLNTTSVSYDATRVAGTSLATILVENLGNAQLNLTGTTLSGSDATAFRVVSAPETVLPGSVTRITVAFTPTSAGDTVAARSKAATLTLASNDPDESSKTVSLSGTAETVVAGVTPGNVTFGEVAVGNTKTATVTVSNDANASADLTVTRSAIVGPDAGAYSVSGVSFPFTLAPGESKTVTVEITPKDTGRKFARLRLFTQDPATQQLDVFLSNRDTIIEVQTTAGSDSSGPGAQVNIKNAEKNSTLPANVSTPGTLAGNVGIQNLNVTIREAGNFSVNFTQADDPVEDAPNFDAPNDTNVAPVKYVRVNKTVSDDQIANATFRIRVSKVQIKESGTDPSEMSLYRFVDGSWVELNSTLVGETKTHYVYSVVTPGFSDFAAGAKKPEFDITNAEIPPGDVSLTAIVVGDTVDVIVRITNEKGAADGTFTTKLLLDGKVVEKRDVTIAAGGTRQIRFVREFTQTGTFSVLVNDVSAGSVEVKNRQSGDGGEGSNDGGKTQLQIEDTSMTQAAVAPGEEVTFSVAVHNPASSAQIYEVPLKINGVTLEIRQFSIAADERKTITYSRSFRREGTYDVTIGDTFVGTVEVAEDAGGAGGSGGSGEDATSTVTPTETPAESTPTDTPDETSDSTSTDTPSGTPTDTPSGTPTDTPSGTPTDTPSGTADGTPTDTPSGTPTDTPSETETETPSGTANITVLNAFLDTEAVSPGDQVTITAIVENKGDAEGTATVDLVVNGLTVASERVTLAPGESKRVTFERRFRNAGTFVVDVNGEPAGRVAVSTPTGTAGTTETATGTTSESFPGFEPSGVIVALLVVALLARRRA